MHAHDYHLVECLNDIFMEGRAVLRNMKLCLLPSLGVWSKRTRRGDDSMIDRVVLLISQGSRVRCPIRWYSVVTCAMRRYTTYKVPRYMIMAKSLVLSALLALGMLGLLSPRACRSAITSNISFPIVLGEFWDIVLTMSTCLLFCVYTRSVVDSHWCIIM